MLSETINAPVIHKVICMSLAPTLLTSVVQKIKRDETQDYTQKHTGIDLRGCRDASTAGRLDVDRDLEHNTIQSFSMLANAGLPNVFCDKEG